MTARQHLPAAETQPWVVTISHRCGDSATLHPTEAAAHATLAELARRWWDETGLPGRQPVR
jgi:hypothetical protein